jgi:hypothetical protein
MVPELLALSPRCQQIMSSILNAVAFGIHAAVGNIDALAEEPQPSNHRDGTWRVRSAPHRTSVTR